MLKNPTVYATSKFHGGKKHSQLHLTFKRDALFKKQRTSRKPIRLQDKVNRLLDFLEEYSIISPVNREQQPKGNIFINSVMILVKIVLDARYVNSLRTITTNTHKHKWTKLTTVDLNSAYNQMPLDEFSCRPTQLVIGNQQNEIFCLFYGITKGSAVFSALMSKNC